MPGKRVYAFNGINCNKQYVANVVCSIYSLLCVVHKRYQGGCGLVVTCMHENGKVWVQFRVASVVGEINKPAATWYELVPVVA